MAQSRWTRRKLLELAAVAIPSVAVVGCSAPTAQPGGGDGGVDGLPGDAGAGSGDDAGALDAGAQADAGDLDGGQDAGMDPDGGAVEQHTCDGSFPRIDLKADCDAVGDGMTNDTQALQKAAGILNAAGGGELVIPPGVYIVGDQTAKTSGSQPGAWYQDEPMLALQKLSCLRISGYGATLKVKPGLHYGGYDPSTGAAGDYTSGNVNAAKVGHVIEVVSSDNVWIEGLEIDGSLGTLVIGGQWGNVDIQAQATGIWLNMCQNVTVVDVHTHHHGLDGITVLYTAGAPPTKMPHTLLRVNSEFNGRQAISWIGGWGLECTDCKFNHTGRTLNAGQPFMSLPRAGIDIEPNAGTTQKSREGVFTRCEFVDNAGPGVLADVGDGGYSTFTDCTMWGTTSYSVWVRKPGMKFSKCRLYGTAVHASDGSTPTNASPNAALATTFEDCTFEDKAWTDGNVYRNGNLYNLSEGAEGAEWVRCTFINHQVRGMYAGDTATAERFDACTFIHSNAGLANGTYQSRFQGCHLRSCLFQESSALAGTYFIDVTSVVVAPPVMGGAPTHVDGPNVKWSSASATGLTGDIAPGTYP